ncbi:MAG: glycosyltransferase family 2 protein [Clostridiales bacterium]|nr:glycosyltransferase family 2 protein [Clostridiales bacterium]
MKLVSVVVATYKREAELKNALESLAKQTYPNMEIVLVDDNGNDEWNSKVSETVEVFRNRYPKIKLECIVNNSNQGSSKTRNIGIHSANGDYITFLDDDDIYLPDKIRKQVEFMETNQCDYSITDLILYNEDDKKINRRIRSYIKETTVESLRLYHLKYHMTGTDTIMFKKEYLIQIGGFAPIDVGDEFYLMQRAIEEGGKFGYLPGCEIKAYVHTGDGGLSSGDGKIKGENALYEYKKTFFNQLEACDIRYIKMRHYAVIAYAELRRKNYVKFISNALKSFLASPCNFFTILKR